MPSEIVNARIAERMDVHESLAVFRVEPRAGAVPSFEPGQFTRLGVWEPSDAGEPRVIRRALSMASSPRDRDHFEFYVVRLPEGAFTSRLFDLPPGSGAWLDSGVYGHLTLNGIPPTASLLMVATGTGLAPFLSMVRTYHGSGRWRRCLLLESVRTAADLGFRAELERLDRECPRFSYRPTLTREPAGSGWEGLRGRVQSWLEPSAFDHLSAVPLEPAFWQVLLCGNPEMIRSVTDLLIGRGFRPHRRRAPGQIRAERYW